MHVIRSFSFSSVCSFVKMTDRVRYSSPLINNFERIVGLFIHLCRFLRARLLTGWSPLWWLRLVSLSVTTEGTMSTQSSLLCPLLKPNLQQDHFMPRTLLNAAAFCRKLRQLSAPATWRGSPRGRGAAMRVSPKGQAGEDTGRHRRRQRTLLKLFLIRSWGEAPNRFTRHKVASSRVTVAENGG